MTHVSSRPCRANRLLGDVPGLKPRMCLASCPNLPGRASLPEPHSQLTLVHLCRLIPRYSIYPRIP